jgi:hypothetical protein
MWRRQDGDKNKTKLLRARSGNRFKKNHSNPDSNTANQATISVVSTGANPTTFEFTTTTPAL